MADRPTSTSGNHSVSHISLNNDAMNAVNDVDAHSSDSMLMLMMNAAVMIICVKNQ